MRSCAHSLITMRAGLHEFVVHVGKYSVINLHDQASAVHGLIFLTKGVRDGENVFFFGWIVFVDAVIGGTGRGDDGEEGFFDGDGGNCSLEIRDRALDALILSRCRTGPTQAWVTVPCAR